MVDDEKLALQKNKLIHGHEKAVEMHRTINTLLCKTCKFVKLV